MNEPKILTEHPNCECGCAETVSQLAFAGLKEKMPGGFSYLKQEIFAPPISTGSALAMLTVDGVMAYWDICSKCGKGRYTRTATVALQAQMQKVPASGFKR